jgi:uncharacterized protein YpmS
MKKTILIIIIIVTMIVLFITAFVMNNNAERDQIKKDNLKYETYLDKTVNGADIASLINKIVEENKKNSILVDEKGLYIDNGENSVRMDIKMITIDKVYPMETIIKNNITFFIQNFGSIEFNCTNIEYHQKTGRVSTLIFEEIE